VPETTWRLPRSEELLRPHPLRRLVEPARERRFTYDRYDAFLARLLADPRVRPLPLRELAATDPEGRVLVGLRHDVDDRLDSALRMAELEYRRGVRATYFPDGGEGLLTIETDGQASPADAAMQDVTARVLAERFERASVWCATTGRAEYAGGQAAEPPAPGTDPPAWYS